MKRPVYVLMFECAGHGQVRAPQYGCADLHARSGRCAWALCPGGFPWPSVSCGMQKIGDGTYAVIAQMVSHETGVPHGRKPKLSSAIPHCRPAPSTGI
jgi:hypothetical protein